MYQTIDENEEQQKYNQVVNKITPESLGLKPTTDFEQYAQQTLIDEDSDKVKQWVDKGSIGVMEAGKRYADEFDFDGNYSNIAPAKKSEYSKKVDKRIADNQLKTQERNKRVNNGTASILDRIGAALDRWGQTAYNAQVQQSEQQSNMQMPHKGDSNYKYKPYAADITGRVLYNETDLRKKINFTEALANSIGRGEALPFVSGIIQGNEIKKYRDITERIKNGETIRQDELNYVNNYIDRVNEEYVRGYTIGGKIGDSILPSLLAFGGEIALGGAALKAVGLAGKGSALALNASKNLLRTGKVSKNVAKGIAFAGGTVAESGLSAAVTTLVNPARMYATYQERRLNDELKITDRGTVIFQESKETPAKAFMKSLGQVYISYFTEGLGGLIGGTGKVAGNTVKSIGATQLENVMKANPALEKFIQKTAPLFAKAYEKLNQLPIKGKSVEWLKGQVKFDGFIEELGEEVLEDVLNLTIGTNNEERSLENYISKIVKTPEEWAVLCGVIALQGTALSVAGNSLGQYMQSNGASFEDIANVSLNSTENEKLELINEAFKRGDVNIDDNALSSEIDVKREEIEDRTYEKLTQAGVNEDVAFANAKLFGQFFKKYGADNVEAFEKWYNKFETRYDVPVDESNSLQQSAMYKAPQNNFKDFYNQVFEKEINTDKSKIKKSYYDYTNENVSVRIPHDTVIHDNNKHQLNVEEWENVLENLNTPVDAVISNKPRFNGEPVLLKIIDNESKIYGVVIEFFNNKQPLVTTAFTDTEENIDKWLNKNRSAQAKNTSSVTTKGMLLSQNLNNIINYVKENLKPKINDTYYQTVETAGAETSADISAAQKEWQEKGTESKYFKKWFSGSKVVNAFGKPMKMYHGTPYENAGFDTFNNSDMYYFSTSENYAEVFADKEFNGEVYECYLSIKKPLDLRQFKNKNITANEFANFFKKINIELSVETLNKINEFQNDDEKPVFRYTRLLNKTDIEQLKQKGYDGIIQNEYNIDTRRNHFNTKKIKGTSYIVFNPEQIKSVNNQGTFDNNNPNIYFQRRINESEGQMKLFQDVMQLNLFQQEQIFSSDNTKENVQQEIKQSYTQDEVKEAKQNKEYEITDVGDSLLGNLKKNKKQYSWQELSEMNDLLRKKYLSKSYIYELPSYEQLKQEGLSDKCIAFINNVYSKINSKPAKGYEKIEYQKIYFDSVHEIMDKTISFVKGNSELIDNHNYGTDNSLFKIIFPDTENKKPYSIFRAYPEYNLKAIITGGNKLIEALYLDYKTEKNLKTIIEKFNKTEPAKNKKETLSGWQKYFDIVEYRGNWVLADRKSGVIFSDRKMPTKELAEKLAENLYQFMNQNARSFEVDFSNLRNYIPRRLDNQNVKPEALIEVFGFRGINFGNWTKQSERQNFVNLAYDSLYDLAELLNLPPKALSLGGRLGLAFGAQGRSKAAGHFIPEYNEINLTRKSGAGSLAHEWWHALDFYFGDQSQDKEFSGVASLNLKNQGSLRDEVYTALMNLNEAIKYSPLTEEDFIAKKDEYKNRYERIIQYTAKDIKTSFYRSKNSSKINELVDNIVNNASTIDLQENKDDKIIEQFIGLLEERRKTFDNLSKMNSLLYQVKNLQRIDEIARAQKKYSDYYTKATKLNDIEKGNGYWTQNTELGARAFASYILDKINQQNYKNEFLVRDEKDEKSFDLNVIAEIINAQLNGAETNKTMQDATIEWYPANPEERTRIFKAFDDLFSNLKTREENKSVILYQSDDSVNEEKLIAGYTYPEVLDKLTELYEIIGNGTDSETEKNVMAKIHVLEDAFSVSENPEKFSNENQRMETMLNAYYVMNDQELPKAYIDTEVTSTRTYNDLLKIHNEKKEKAEREYYGYFTQEGNKNIITIMANNNASTALHELGHLFLNGLNELAQVNENARKQLETVNKWLNYSGEYTVAQQEKFARSFEAYLYRGKAPNNYLKQVFENFKEWLKSVYHHITDIEFRGADISAEVQEMFDNMFGNDSYYQEKKQATELLNKIKSAARKEKFENISTRDDNTLTDTQKRHKDVSYQILSVATGKDINYLKRIFETNSNKNGYGRRREIVEELLEHADDKITTSGGMREEWKAFYGDTGVSYENDEIGGDYELAEQALDVIINKRYYDPEIEIENEADQRAKYYEREIDNANRQYKIIISEYKKGNRDVVLSAAYEWLNGLDREIKNDYENKFIFDTGIIERDDKIDKFDKAKRKILEKALSFNNPYATPNDESYKELVKEIMKNLDFLQPADKAKLTANILDVPSTNFLMSSIDNILDIAKTMEDINLRRKLEIEIHKELQGTKNVKKGGRTVGKYNYKANKIFEELRNLDRLSPEAANERRLQESNLIKAEDEGLSYQEKLVNKFLSYKSGGRTFADTELMKELYDEIVKIKLVGKSAKSELDLQEKLSEQKDIDELIDIVQKKKNAKLTIKAYISGLGNLESTLNAIFNKDIKERYGSEILYAETNAQAWQHEQKEKFEKEVAEIYGLPQWCWDKKILEYLAEKHTYPELRRKYDKDNNLVKVRSIDRTLTKMDIIQAYIWSKNEVLEKRLLNQFGEDTLYTMFDELSLEDVKLAELLMNTAQSFYPLVNKAFIKKYGLDLPRVSCYFPSSPERGSEVDMYNDYSAKSLNNGFTKARSGSELLPMDFHNPITALYSHIDGVGKFAFMSESLDIANKRFKDNDLKRVIVNKYGEDAYRTLEQILMNVTYKKERTVFNGVNKILDNMIGNWIQANVAIKPIVGLKQLLSANNYAVDMPYMKWQAGFLKALANPKATIDYMMKIPYLKARFGGNFSNEFLKQTIENSAFAASKKLKDACTIFIKIGDVGAIVFGGKPYIDYLVNEKGMTEDQAIKQFVLATNRSQQSSAVSSLSNFQVNMTRNPLGKLFIAFKNSPQQYMRMCGDAIVSCANGDMTVKQAAKAIYQYGYLQPFLYAVATSGSLLRFLLTGDDDDLISDAVSSIFNFNADGLPVIGDLYLFAMRKGIMKGKYLPQTTPLTGDIQREISRISKEDVTLQDWLEAVGYMGLHVGLGYNSKAIGSMSSGVIDITKGDVAKGSLKVLGYTDKRARHITKKND